MDIYTPEDWWYVVDKYWDNLLGIMERFLPMNEVATDNQYEDGRLLGYTVRTDVLFSKKTRDWERLKRYLWLAWDRAPDTRGIHDIPGWYDLCDLLSEDWVLAPE